MGCPSASESFPHQGEFLLFGVVIDEDEDTDGVDGMSDSHQGFL